MPSIRDILKGVQADSSASSLEQAEGQWQAVQGTGAGNKPGANLATEISDRLVMAERLRVAAEQRTALARLDVERQQASVDQLKDQIEEIQNRNLPPGELSSQLNNAQARLDDAKADLARAEEAQLNTELTTNLKIEHQQNQGEKHGNTLREKLGNKIGGPKPSGTTTKPHLT
jgi:hypothetical protein